MPAENQKTNSFPVAGGAKPPRSSPPDSLMNWTIKYEREGGFVRVTVAGLYNVKDHMQMLEDVAGRDFWKPGMNLLIDDRALDFKSTSLEELREAGRRRAEMDKLIGGGKTAVLVASLTDFARARQFELITSGKVSTKMDIFKSEDDALSWLLAAGGD